MGGRWLEFFLETTAVSGFYYFKLAMCGMLFLELGVMTAEFIPDVKLFMSNGGLPNVDSYVALYCINWSFCEDCLSLTKGLVLYLLFDFFLLLVVAIVVVVSFCYASACLFFDF